MLATLEVALALVLLVGAGMFLRSLWRLQNVETGFQPRGVMTGLVLLPQTRYRNAEEQIAFYRATLERLSGIPGVVTAAEALPIPFSGGVASGAFRIEGRVRGAGEPEPQSNIQVVSPDYFSTLSIPLRGGRIFTEHDVKGGQPVVVIDENLAQQYWPNENPIGHRINRFDDQWWTIVGIAGHVKQSDLAADSSKGVCYFPLYQQPFAVAALLVKTSLVKPESVVSAMQEAVRTVDPTQSIGNLKTMQERVLATLGSRRFASLLLAFFAGTALFLAALGLYWVISFGVTLRTREIGTRMALGAQSHDVLVMVIHETLVMGVSGLAIGTIGAFLLTHTISSLLYGVASTDAPSFLFGTMCLLLVIVIAGYLPARRAAGVDPLVALRCE
jgi:predicted permease